MGLVGETNYENPADVNPHHSFLLRELQNYMKGYKLNPQVESEGKDYTALAVGLSIGVVFFFFPFFVIAVRRYILRYGQSSATERKECITEDAHLTVSP